MWAHGFIDLDRRVRPVYQAVEFRQALLSSSMVLAIGLAAYLFFRPSITLLGNLGWSSVAFGVLGGALTYLVVFIITRQYLLSLRSMRDLMLMLSSLFRNFSWPAIIFISAMAGISEELLLRGLLQHYLVEFTNPAFGIIVASLVFGLMHYLSRLYVVVTFALGLAFGVAYHVSDSLLLVIIAHAVYDVLAFALLVKYPHWLGIQN